MSAKVKVSGAWKDSEIRVKVSGAWKNVEKGYVKVAGVWEAFLDAIIPLTNSTYDGVSFDVTTEDGGLTGIFFKPDGTKLYMCGTDTDSVYQYSLSTAWDLSTASYDSVTLDVSTENNAVEALFFKPDGTKLYIVNNEVIYQYSLSTAWDLSTASYDSLSFSLVSTTSYVRGLRFKPDGTKLYVVDATDGFVYQYTVNTAWSMGGTITYDSVSLDINSEFSAPFDLIFDQAGENLYVVGRINSTIKQYSLSTAWDLSTASYTGASYSFSSEDTTGVCVSFKTDGSKMYIGHVVSDILYQYSVPV